MDLSEPAAPPIGADGDWRRGRLRPARRSRADAAAVRPRDRPRVALAARVRAAPLAPAARPAGLRRPRRAAAHPRPVNIALAHEYFVAHGGAERVVETFHQMWPGGPVYTFFHDRRRYGDLPGWNLRTSYLQHLLLGESHRLLLPLYPNAARALRVPPETDVALVPTSAFIKEIGLADRTVAVAYCHSPTRYLYDWSERYLEEEVPQPLVPLVRDLLGRLRDGDQRAARRFDRWMANSTAVRGRIETYYGVTASAIEIVHPPVDGASFAANDERSPFWLFVGRLASYKS